MTRQDSDKLDRLGWRRYQIATQPQLPRETRVGRVTAESKRYYFLSDGNLEYLAEISGKLLHRTTDRSDFPAVGDWITFHTPESRDRAVIDSILIRQTCLARKGAGTDGERQIIAANLDRVFIVQAMDENFKTGKLERFLAIAHDSGAEPVLVLSKTDLAGDERESRYRDALEIASQSPVVAMSSITGEGLDRLEQYLEPGTTCCMIGPSGAGKSTLLNRLAGSEVARTANVREVDMRGRHTTTHRELFLLDSGVILIDTPGIREIGLDVGDEALDDVFPDIAQISTDCRFRDCTHTVEPDCAVIAARNSGELPSNRYSRYMKLKAEISQRESRTNIQGKISRKRHAKRIHKAFSKTPKKGR